MWRILCGVGSLFLSVRAASPVVPSSGMMSLHSSMHSSQMNTDGPAMSLRTSCWLFPQKEQYNSLSLEDLSAIQIPAFDCSDTTLRARNPLLQDFIDDSVFLGLLGREEVVALGVPGDLLDR